MSWLWIAAPIVGVIGVITTYLAGGRQQKATLEVATRQLNASAEAVREERRQRLIESAYKEMMTAMRRVYYWAFEVYPPMTQTPEQYTMPPMPQLDDPAASEALWSTYWSARVEQLMDEWELAIRKLQIAGWTMALARRPGPRGPGSIDEAEVMQGLPGTKQAVVDA